MKKIILIFGIILITANVAVAKISKDDAANNRKIETFLSVSRIPTHDANNLTKHSANAPTYQQDPTGKPVSAALNPLPDLSLALSKVSLKESQYKGNFDNIYTVPGPGAVTGGRTVWGIVLVLRILMNLSTTHGLADKLRNTRLKQP